VNVDKVERLTAAGRICEPGLAEVRKARQDGRRDAAYASQETATVPPDLGAALDGRPEAKAAFETLDRTGRYLLVLPLLQARTPEARRTRLDKALRTLSGQDGQMYCSVFLGPQDWQAAARSGLALSSRLTVPDSRPRPETIVYNPRRG
jgi:uncharacterized protein YdeI (YjbR/CyaY-like superfamily)